MFTLFRKKNTASHHPEHDVVAQDHHDPHHNPAVAASIPSDTSHHATFRKPGTGLLDNITRLFQQKKQDRDSATLLRDIETALLLADTGTIATQKLVDQLNQYCKQQKNPEPTAILHYFQQQLVDLLRPSEQPLHIPEQHVREQAKHLPFVILVVGVNGVGKTTTIAKLARRLQQQNKKVSPA